MSNRSGSRGGRLALGILGLLALIAAPSVAATSPDDAAETRLAARERDGGKLQDLVDAEGALGIYFDEASGDHVVVVPSSGGSSFNATAASKLSLSVRVERRDIDRKTIDAISAALEALHADIEDQSYRFGFDPASGTVELVSEAPESEFATVMEAFPGKITFRSGVIESTASRCADTAPFSGGACLDGPSYCTSGFALDFNAGGRYMVTAGHCFANGAHGMARIRSVPLLGLRAHQGKDLSAVHL